MARVMDVEGQPDFLDEIIVESEMKSPGFASQVDEAHQRMQLPKLFQLYRNRRDLSQHEAAREIGVSVASLDSYEQGRRYPKAQQLDALFTAYDLIGSEQVHLLRMLSEIRPRSYRWVAALIATDPDPKLLRKTLKAYADLGEGDSPRVARANVPVPLRVFPRVR